ncbi:MAG: hypothetical protein KME43_26735 [Myxacorys chilensis ATA2-1-KO14]|nr:hypothetical protein [Myxacorys chilensis ATA2-1-KO14]
MALPQFGGLSPRAPACQETEAVPRHPLAKGNERGRVEKRGRLERGFGTDGLT